MRICSTDLFARNCVWICTDNSMFNIQQFHKKIKFITVLFNTLSRLLLGRRPLPKQMNQSINQVYFRIITFILMSDHRWIFGSVSRNVVGHFRVKVFPTWQGLYLAACKDGKIACCSEMRRGCLKIFPKFICFVFLWRLPFKSLPGERLPLLWNMEHFWMIYENVGSWGQI